VGRFPVGGFFGKLAAVGAAAGIAATKLPELLEHVAGKAEVPKETPDPKLFEGFKIRPEGQPDLAHHLDMAKEHVFTRPNESFGEAGGILSPAQQAPFSDFDEAIEHLRQVPGSEKAIQRAQDLKKFHVDLNTPGGMSEGHWLTVPEAEDFSAEQFWKEHAFSHAVDELSTQHGLERVPHPEETVDFNPSATTILDDFGGVDAEKRLARLSDPNRKWKFGPEQKEAIVDGLQTQINFKKAVQDYLQAHPQETEAGLIADWYAHPDLSGTPGSPSTQTALGKILDQHYAGPDPDYLTDSLFEHLEKYP
jgi:hypothetical protein